MAQSNEIRVEIPHSPSASSTITALSEDLNEAALSETDMPEIASLQPVDWLDLRENSMELNDNVINACQALLKRQHPTVSSFYDTVVVAALTPDLKIDTAFHNNAIQIFHDNVNKHWFCATNRNCADGHLSVYCSLQMNPSSQCMAAVANLFNIEHQSLTLNIMNVVKQRGAIDCGLYAVAYAEILCREQDPCNIVLNQALMRKHVLRCLQERRIKEFPVLCNRTIHHQVVRSFKVSLYCSCRSTHQPGESMLQCDGCTEWYHQRCLKLSEAAFAKLAETQSTYNCARCEGLKPQVLIGQPPKDNETE